MNAKTIQKLVSELCTLPGSNVADFEPDPAKRTMGQVVRDSLGKALQRCCKTDEIAVKVVERLMQGQFRPTVAQITQTASEISHIDLELPEGCEICNGEPWVTVEKVVWEFPQAREGNRGVQYRAAGSERCRCTKGQWFRMKDRENDAKRAAGQPV